MPAAPAYGARMPSLLLLLLYCAVAVLTPSPAAAAEEGGPRWRSPVAHAELAAPYAFDPSHPFAARQRRGVDLVAAPGTEVDSACGGLVTYAGRVPWGGRGVTIRCGALVATHLGLEALTVGRGTRVVPGQRLGLAGPRGVVRLGARVAGRRWGYIDPLGLLTRDIGPRPLLPTVRAPRAPGPSVRRPFGIRPVPVPVAVRRYRPSVRGPAAEDMPVTVLLWGGVALLALGLGVHGALWRSGPGRAVRTALRPAPPRSRGG
jgi:Peptidase family M23